MTKYQIKDRFTGEVAFTAQIKCSKHAPDGVKKGLALYWALTHQCDLTSLDFSGGSFRYSKPRNWDFSTIDLSHCDFRDADFQNADLWRVNFTGCDFRGADFTRARLNYANLTDAKLAGANFTDAIT